MSIRNVIIFAVLLLLSACSTTPTQLQKPLIKKGELVTAQNYIRQFTQNELEQHNIAGISIAAVITNPSNNTALDKPRRSDVELRWREGFGLADIENNVAVNEDTVFRAGSLAKLINTIAILKLQQRNLLALHDPVQHYIPELQINSRFNEKTITIENLLTHQSGFPSDWISGMWHSEPDDYQQVISYLNSVYVSQPPNTVFQYSNIAHDVLAIIIGRVSGQSYASFVEQEIFQPLQMQHTSLSQGPTVANTALSYEKGKQIKEFATRDFPAAGLNTTPGDYAKIIAMIMHRGGVGQGSFLSETSIDSLLHDYSSQLPLNVGKRFALSLHYYDDVFASKFIVYGHDGATPGQRSLFKFSPELGLGVVVSSNSKHASNVLHRVANQCLQSLYQVKFGHSIPYPYVHIAQPQQQDIVTQNQLQGYYATRLGLAQIYQKRDQLFAKFLGKKFKLQQDENSALYFLNYKLFGLFNIDLGYYGRLGLSVRNISGDKYLVGTNNLQQQLLIGQSISASDIPNVWRQKVGPYKVVNPLEVMKLPSGGITIQEGFLIAHAKTEEGQQLEFVLQPQNDSQAIVAGVGRGLGETVFVEKREGEEMLKFADIFFKKTGRKRKIKK